MIDPTVPLTPIPFGSPAWWSLRDRVAGSREQHPDRPCIRCAARFTPKVGNQVYCSTECQREGDREAIRLGREITREMRLAARNGRAA